ncbi:MAG: AraC family transcriptional regulator [bacterium]|nr:AraC family transcriptional regulator [bacterium]
MILNPAYYSTFNSDFSETIAYNDPLFPAYIRPGVLSAYPDYSAVSHWHKDLEFIVIKRGSMTYNVNGELIELSEGSGIMINSRQLHYGFSPEHKECEFICIILSPGIFSGNEWFYRNYVEPVTENPLYPYIYLAEAEWEKAILKKIDGLYTAYTAPSEQESRCFAVFDAFAAVLKILYENLDVKTYDTKKESSELTSLKNMLAYIEEHFSQRIALSDLASAGVCCKSRCSFLFKKFIHETPMTYVARLRLRKSLAALLDSDNSISDIAYEYGFCGASYYCETFQKYYGMSPLKYRQLSHVL